MDSHYLRFFVTWEGLLESCVIKKALHERMCSSHGGIQKIFWGKTNGK